MELDFNTVNHGFGSDNSTDDTHYAESTLTERETLESDPRYVSIELASSGSDINMTGTDYECLSSNRNESLYNTMNDNTYDNINDVQVGSISIADSSSVSSRAQLTKNQIRKNCPTDCKKRFTKKCLVVSLTIAILAIIILVLLLLMFNKDPENGIVSADGYISSGKTVPITSQSFAITGNFVEPF